MIKIWWQIIIDCCKAIFITLLSIFRNYRCSCLCLNGNRINRNDAEGKKSKIACTCCVFDDNKNFLCHWILHAFSNDVITDFSSTAIRHGRHGTPAASFFLSSDRGQRLHHPDNLTTFFVRKSAESAILHKRSWESFVTPISINRFMLNVSEGEGT